MITKVKVNVSSNGHEQEDAYDYQEGLTEAERQSAHHLALDFLTEGTIMQTQDFAHNQEKKNVDAYSYIYPCTILPDVQSGIIRVLLHVLSQHDT